jgi:APA family basic amino acid/polyamine antiporter
MLLTAVAIIRRMHDDEGNEPHHSSLGPLGALAVIAGSMLGVGIFLTPATVAQEVSAGWSYQLLWALGGLVALSGAGAYAELGARFPRAGGDYVFLRHTFGNSLAFAAGWLLVVGVFAGSLASMSTGICQYQLPTLLPDAAAGWLADT